MNIKDIDKKIEELNQLRNILNKKVNANDTVFEIIFKKYLETEKVSEVAKYLNNTGYRINSKRGTRKYIAQDISSIIKNKDIEIRNKELKNIVIKLFNSHKKGIKKANW